MAKTNILFLYLTMCFDKHFQTDEKILTDIICPSLLNVRNLLTFYLCFSYNSHLTEVINLTDVPCNQFFRIGKMQIYIVLIGYFYRMLL